MCSRTTPIHSSSIVFMCSVCKCVRARRATRGGPVIHNRQIGTRNRFRTAVMSKSAKDGAQQTSLLDVLKKKMRQAREEAEQAKGFFPFRLFFLFR